jgi:hypothetical protein
MRKAILAAAVVKFPHIGKKLKRPQWQALKPKYETLARNFDITIKSDFIFRLFCSSNMSKNIIKTYWIDKLKLVNNYSITLMQADAIIFTFYFRKSNGT